MPDAEHASYPFTVFVAEEKTSVKELLSAVRRSAGPFLMVVGQESMVHLTEDEIRSLFTDAKALNVDRRLLLATQDNRVATIAQESRWQTISSIKQLKLLLLTHPSSGEAIRAYSPVSWRRDIRSRLQFVGLLSLPKLRIWGLLGFSVLAFTYVFLRLLPSATIRIWSHQQSGSFTTNIYMAESGSQLPVSADRVTVLRLKRLTVKIEDPVFYTKPFTYGRNVRREKKDVRLMPARCADNERSLVDALPGMQGPEHKKAPTFPK